MTTKSKWQYDEMTQCGIDFADPAEVEGYEASHGRLDDFEGQAKKIIEQLGIGPDHIVMDMGCGTGRFVYYAVPKCKHVIAVDVSQAMLDFCRRKCEQEGLSHIEYHKAGFLTYQHSGEPVDGIVCRLALHHLSDFWKLIGLRNMASALKPGGKLYLFDVVFSFDIHDFENAIEKWIETIVAAGGDTFKERIETHIREEYSTFDWIMEGLLERSGFDIEKKEYSQGFVASYVCVKK